MRITAGIVVRNEAPFLRQSVCSIAPFVNRVILVENGSIDGSDLICDELSNNLSNVVAVHLGYDASLATARNVIDDLTTDGWIIWWDADFIAYSDVDGEKRSFSRMVQLLHEAPPAQNQILYGGPNVGPTFSHVKSNKLHHGGDGDVQVTKKGLMRFRVDKYIDTRYYTHECVTKYVCSPEDQYFLHLDKVKPLTRLALRANLYDYEAQRFSKPPNERLDLLEFMCASNTTFSLPNLLADVAHSLADSTGDFDFGKYGPHPEIIADLIAHPFYEITLDETGKRTLNSIRHFTRNDGVYLRPYFLTERSLGKETAVQATAVLAPSRRLAFLKDATIDGLSDLEFDIDSIGRFVWVGKSFCLTINALADGDFLRIGIATEQPDITVYVTPLDDVRLDTVAIRLPSSGVHTVSVSVGWSSKVEVRLLQQASREYTSGKFKIYYISKTSSPNAAFEIFYKNRYLKVSNNVTFVDALKILNS